MKRLFYIIAAVGLLLTGYAVGVSSTMTSQAGPLLQNSCQSFPETKQAVCGRFLKYWQEHGGLAQQGFPISSEFQEKSELNGQTYTVQYFERAVFELHPENAAPNDVLLSQLGTFQFKRKYGSGTPGAGATPQPTTAPAQPTALPPAMVDIGDPVRRNGMVFTVIRLDRLAKRTDVTYTVKNESGEQVTFVLANADQKLLNDANQPLELANPSGVQTVTLQNGQEFTGGTTFNGGMPADADNATYIADNITRIGSVRVRIPLR
ncbi:MAG: hypothetical protein ABI670_19760 [Chloroflexota bacterium]